MPGLDIWVSIETSTNSPVQGMPLERAPNLNFSRDSLFHIFRWLHEVHSVKVGIDDRHSSMLSLRTKCNCISEGKMVPKR